MRHPSRDDRQSTISNPLDELDLSGTAAGAPDPPAVEILFDGTAEAPTADAASSAGSPLFDLPLSLGGKRSPAEAPPSLSRVPASQAGAAPLRARFAAFAADVALVLLLTAAPLLAATAGSGPALAPRGLWATAAFALYLSFFATVVPLILFGKTVGMALTGLTARGIPGALPLTAAEASRRWIGTALEIAGLGVPLLVTRRDVSAPSLADRLSRRPLAMETVES